MVKYHLVTFGSYDHCGSGDILFLIGHVMSQDHVTLYHVTLLVGALQSKSLLCQIW